MRCSVLAAALVIASAASTTPVKAQSLFDFFFGKPKSSRSVRDNARAYRSQRVRLTPNQKRSSVRRSRRRQERQPFNLDKKFKGQQSLKGRYRTVCVRLCDGYYFPISYGVSRRVFAQDEASCQSRCSSDSELFYFKKGGAIGDAVNREGFAYKKIRTAFLYRKKKIRDCSCQPKPWSYQAKARHVAYAETAKRQQAEQRLRESATSEWKRTGVSAVVARQLFGDAHAEALPPAPLVEKGKAKQLANIDETEDNVQEAARQRPREKIAIARRSARRSRRVLSVKTSRRRASAGRASHSRSGNSANPAAAFLSWLGSNISNPQGNWPGD